MRRSQRISRTGFWRGEVSATACYMFFRRQATKSEVFEKCVGRVGVHIAIGIIRVECQSIYERTC